MYTGTKSGNRLYYPDRPDLRTAPKYSLGTRQTNGPSSLINVISTPSTVNPATYRTEDVTYLSKWQKPSKWSFPQAGKGTLYRKPYDRHQTYGAEGSMGKQTLSSKKTSSKYKIGNETRDGRQKTGIFKSCMSQPPLSVRIPLPKF